MKKQIIAVSLVALFLIAAMFAAADVLSSKMKPTVVDGYVHSGSTIYTSGSAGVPITVGCLLGGSTVQRAVTNSNGYFRVTIPAGQCSLGRWVAVSAQNQVKNRKLLIETSQNNVLSFDFFNGG